MTAAISTTGLLLQRETAVPGTYATVSEVTNVAGPNESAAQIDVSSFDSTAHEFLTGLPDSGELTFDMNFVGNSAPQQGLRADLRAGTVRNFKLILKDDATQGARTTCTFAALVTALSGPKGGVDGAVTQSCTLKISGQPTWAYHA